MMKGSVMKILRPALCLLLIVIVMLAGCEKVSYEWLKYKDDQTGNAYFYKKGDVEKSTDKYVVQVWGKEVYSNQGREHELQSRAKDGLSNAGYDRLSYKRCLYEIDCQRKKISILTIFHYDTDGKELYAGGSDLRRWFDIEPGSTGDDLQKQVCR